MYILKETLKTIVKKKEERENAEKEEDKFL